MDKKEQNKFQKSLKALWLFVFVVVLIGWGIVFAISQGWVSKIPDISDLQNPINKSASRVYSADGKLMGTWSYASANRMIIPYDSLPDNLIKALVATEDERFYEHSGIDFRALGRAIVKRGFMGQKSAGGGSTLTQQLAKQLYSDVARDEKERLMQKPVEWYIAVQLERCYTKEEIIAMYLNYFDFLNNAVGIKNAARTYFDTTPDSLNLEQCATLVGMCKNPALYKPFKYDPSTDKRVVNQACIERRNVVLSQMKKAGYISDAEFTAADNAPLDPSLFNNKALDHKEGPAPYFREYLRKIMMASRPERENYASWQNQQFFADSIEWDRNPLYGWCNKHTKKDGSHYNIYTDGLKIYTTLDTRMQKLAEAAAFRHVAKYLQPAFENEIRGLKYPPYRRLSEEKVSQIVNRYIRQSERYRVMKEAGASDEEIEKAFNTPIPMTLFKYGETYDDPIEYETMMSPRDSVLYYKKFLRTAMCAIDPSNGHVKAYVPGLNFKYFQYDNVFGGGRRQVGSTIKPILYSLAMMNDYNPCDLISTQRFSSGGWSPKGGAGGGKIPIKRALATSNNTVSARLLDLLSVPALVKHMRDLGITTYLTKREMNLTMSLGSCDIALGEMVSAYTVFPSNGVHFFATCVTRIEDAEGNVIETFLPRMNEVMSEEKAWQMIDMMRGVVNQGTGRPLRGGPYSIHADICGKTGTTNSNADGWYIGYCPKLVVGCWVGGEDRDIHSGSMSYGQGARAALPIWGHFMRSVYNHPEFGITERDTFSIRRGFDYCASELEDLERAAGNDEGYSRREEEQRRWASRGGEATVVREVRATEEGEIDEAFQ